MAGAAATVQRISRWAVEPDVGVGEGGTDGTRCGGGSGAPGPGNSSGEAWMGMGPNPRAGPGQVRGQSCLMTLASLASSVYTVPEFVPQQG